MLDVLRGTEAYRVLSDLYARLDLAVVGVGSLSPDSSTVRDGLFTADQLRQIAEHGGVGTICARFIDGDGEPVKAFEDRTISITFEQLLAFRPASASRRVPKRWLPSAPRWRADCSPRWQPTRKLQRGSCTARQSVNTQLFSLNRNCCK